MSGWPRSALRTFFAAVAFMALVVVALGGPANANGVNAALKIRWFAGVVALTSSVILLVFGRLPKSYPNNGESLGEPTPTSPTIGQVVESMRQISHRYKSDVLYLFQQVLHDPSQYLTRATEIAHINDGSLKQDVTLNYAIHDATAEMISEAGEKTILLPLMRLKKGTMLDNLELWDTNDRPLAALLQSETYGILAYVIDKLFRQAYFGDTQEAQTRALSDFEAKLFWTLVDLVCHVGRVSSEVKEAIFGLLSPNLVGSAASPTGAPSTVDKVAVKRLIEFCDFFSSYYLIIVEAPLPVGSRLILRYSRTIPIYEQTATFTDRLRVRLGLSPFGFTYPLTLPFDAHSYHFRMPAGSARFLVDQRLIDSQNGRSVNQATYAGENPRPYLRLRHHSGLPYAHFYTRGLNQVPRHDLWTRIEFDEVPPGVLGGAAVISTTCAILIWFFTLIQPGLRGVNTNTDMPALLLALPAFAATFVGHSAERVLRSSIASYAGLAIAGVTSACSALVYIANANHKSLYTINHFTLFNGLVRLSNIDISWVILALIASLSSAYLVEVLRDKVRWYMRMLERWRKLA